jgi:tetratricopeptide (TPR) repeat protein
LSKPLGQAIALILLWISPSVHSDPADQTWLRLTGAEIELVTNLDAIKAESLFRSVEQFRPVADRFIGRHDRRGPPLKILAFKSRGDFVNVTKPRHFAAFTQPELNQTLLVIAPSGGRDSLVENAKHEYAHYRLRSAEVSFPLWYEEGLATLLGTTRLIDRRDALEVITQATPPLEPKPTNIGQWRTMSLGEVLGARRVDQWPYARVADFYRQSTQLVHFLTFGHERGYVDRRPGLTRHLEDRSRSLHASLDVSEARLKREFERYVRKQRRAVIELPIAPITTKIDTEVVARPEVLRTLALAAEETNPKKAIAYLEKLAELSPNDPEPLAELSRLHRGEGDTELAAHHIRRAQAINRTHPSVLIQEATLALGGCWDPADECVAEWRRAAELSREALDVDPSRLDGIYLLGIAELYTGQPGQAKNYLHIAFRQAPWSPRLNYHYGECLRLLGDPRAERYLINARDWAESDTWRELAELSLDANGPEQASGPSVVDDAIR